MKKFLSLVLALVMTMSLVTVAGAKDFTDSADVSYDEAVDVISALGIVGGREDGSFDPKGTLTRGAAAKIICSMLIGPEYAGELAAETAPFADVPADSVYAGYIAYCANEGIVGGFADGTFKPYAPLNGNAFLKMLLGVVGYKADIEGYTGSNYAVNVLLDAKESKLLENLDGKFVGIKNVTREEACLYAFNALKAPKAFYANEGDKITIGDVEFITGASSVDFKKYDVASVLFEDLKIDTNVSADDLGRPAHAWYIEMDKEDDIQIGTYADEATLVLDKFYSADDFADAIEDADLEIGTKKVGTEEVAIIDNTITANGKTVEFFDKDEDGVIEAGEYVEIAPFVVNYDKMAYGKDSIRTKDKDERWVSFDGYKVVADKDVTKGGVELENFEALYEAVSDEDDELKVLVTKTAGKNPKAFAVEILEAVEADITRVKTGDKQIVADGEVYDCAYDVVKAADIDEAKLYVAENGVVYAIAGVTSDVSDVIYVSFVSYEENKWGEYTVTAQIVTEDNEIAEVVLANDKDADDKGADKKADAEFDEADAKAMVKAWKGEFATYEVDDDEYTLTAAVDAVKDYKKLGAMDEDKAYVMIDGDKVYVASDLEVVYIGKAGTKDLEVTVKEGVQDDVKGDFYVKNSDGKLAIVYVLAAYSDGESDDVIFLADGDFDAYVKDLEGDKVKAYDAYIDGEKVELPIAGTVTAGFWTYEIDADTGVYTLKTPKGYNTAVTAGKTITEGTYVSYADKTVTIDDATVTGEIYDLTEEGLYTLKSINDWAKDGGKLTIFFMYDKDENEVTALYVK